MTPASPLAVAATVATDLVARGATAVALVGSHARGEAHELSDVDIVALGRGDAHLRVVDGLLVSESWLAHGDVEALWSDVPLVGQTVPGWRSAHPLLDPHGEIAGLTARAEAWTWESLGDAPDEWIRDELPGFAEEVFRLTGHVLAGRRLAAAVMRNVCANRMAVVLGVHHRLLYETENRLWDLVADHMGAPWRTLQLAAFGIDVSFEASCWAAADLFAMTAETVADVLDADGRAVVAAAVDAVGLRRGPGS